MRPCRCITAAQTERHGKPAPEFPEVFWVEFPWWYGSPAHCSLRLYGLLLMKNTRISHYQHVLAYVPAVHIAIRKCSLDHLEKSAWIHPYIEECWPPIPSPFDIQHNPYKKSENSEDEAGLRRVSVSWKHLCLFVTASFLGCCVRDHKSPSRRLEMYSSAFWPGIGGCGPAFEVSVVLRSLVYS